MKDIVLLNGTWLVDYLSDKPYTATEEPTLNPKEESVTACPVPGYWEDLTDLFRTTALHTKLHWNPMYTYQTYPQAGYMPDLALPNPVGCFIYQKTVTLQQAPAAETELSFGGAQNAVSAWVNGQYLGRHEGYSAPFAFSVPAGVLQAGENRITLAVSNNRLQGYRGRPVSGLTSRAANECTGGIYGDVELRTYPDGLKDVWVSTARDGGSFTVHTEGAEMVAKTVTVSDEKGERCTITIPAGENSVTVDADGYARWSPDAPNLYIATVKTANQTVVRRFGIRRLTVEGTRLMLNGEPYFFRGTCEHCYQPVTVHPTRDKRYYRMVLRTLKELGFNSIRFHTWVPPYEYMEAADELGMVMEVESPNNTSLEEWREIVRFCRRYAAVNMYSTGNEMQIDFDYEKHLEACAALVHAETDSLFSPMSAMRGIEYNFINDETVKEPFQYNPARLARVGEYCDVYNTFSQGKTSYNSTTGKQPWLDKINAVYGKPLLSHEICINGTYIDLSLEERYEGTRIGQTPFMSSVRKHLADKGLLDRANLYYRNSAAWQQQVRKHCFETLRRCETFAGYDFLGDIDTHWHTFGYCVGMMNEFYELKPGETVENVRRYNSDTVLLADLPSNVNLQAGDAVEIPIVVSHYGKTLPKATLQVRVSAGGKVLLRKEIKTGEIVSGTVSELYRLQLRLPRVDKPQALRLIATLSGGDTDCDNGWDLYVFPKTVAPTKKLLRENRVTVLEEASLDQLSDLLKQGKAVVLFGTGPFPYKGVIYQIACAGRGFGHLATAIADHPIMADFPHDGYCGKQFETMLNGGSAVVLESTAQPHRPVIDIACSYKNAHREAMLTEYYVGAGRLLVCTLNLRESDPGAVWLKNRILSYAAGEEFAPEQTLTIEQFEALCRVQIKATDINHNLAMNQNDITM